jgi:hypothetical protein
MRSCSLDFVLSWLRGFKDRIKGDGQECSSYTRTSGAEARFPFYGPKRHDWKSCPSRLIFKRAYGARVPHLFPLPASELAGYFRWSLRDGGVRAFHVVSVGIVAGFGIVRVIGIDAGLDG